MPAVTGKITLHMVASLDGKIAKKDNSIGWFDTTSNYEKGVAGEDPETFLKTIDCYVMGSHTYEHALELSKTYGWAYGETPTIVISSRNLSIDQQNIELYSGDLVTLVNEKLKPVYQNIWLAGGANLAQQFIQLQLVDEIRLSILPIILGEGKLFFEQIVSEQLLELKNVIAYKNGMVELHYEIKKQTLADAVK